MRMKKIYFFPVLGIVFLCWIALLRFHPHTGSDLVHNDRSLDEARFRRTRHRSSERFFGTQARQSGRSGCEQKHGHSGASNPGGSQNALKTTPSFQLLEDLSTAVYVYSALWQGDNVRTIAIKRREAKVESLYCLLWPPGFDFSRSFLVQAKVDDIPEDHGANYTAAYITCPVYEGNARGEDAPAFVSFVPDKSLVDRPKVTLPIEGREIERSVDETTSLCSEKETGVEFTVCTPPMFDRFHHAHQVVEKIEMSRLLGAGRVVFYNNNISSNVASVLRMYAEDWRQGRETIEVKVYPWELPTLVENGVSRTMNKESDIHYYGQMAAVDHCLHRYRDLSRYIVFTDLDEFIVPVHHETWSELIASFPSKLGILSRMLDLFRKQGSRYSGFMFQSTVFNIDRPSPAPGFELKTPPYGSAVLGYTSRDNYFFPPSQRSKLIVDPKTVDVMGIHFIWKCSDGTQNVPVDQGFLAHYRRPLNDCQAQLRDTRPSDRFGEKLFSRIRHVWSRLKNVPSGWERVEHDETIKCPTNNSKAR